MQNSAFSPLELGPRLAATVVLSFASLIYEFVIAQLLSSLIGGAIFQYSITIAVYTFFLGVGAYFYGVFAAKVQKEKVFFWVEMALAACAVCFPLLILFLPTTSFMGILRIDCVAAYVSMMAIGFLSGVELPYLLDSRKGKNLILGSDYIGMFVASVAFPFVLLPSFGALPTAFTIAALNLAVAFQTIAARPVRVLATVVALGFLFWALANSQDINAFSTEIFLRKFHA